MSKFRLLWGLGTVFGLTLLLLISTVPNSVQADTPTTTPTSALTIYPTRTAAGQGGGGENPTPASTPGFDPETFGVVAATQTALAPQALLSAEAVAELEFEGQVQQTLLTTDQTRLLIRTHEGKIFVYSLTGSTSKRILPDFVLIHGTSVQGMVLGAGDTRLATWNDADSQSPSMMVRVWDLTNGTLIHETDLRDNAQFLSKNGLKWNRDGSALVAWSRVGAIVVWDAVTFEERLTLKLPTIVWGVAWNPDETRLMAWTTEHGVQIFDANSGITLFQLGHREAALNALWSPDGRYILTASTDGIAGLWNGVTGEPLNLYYHASYQPGRPDPRAGIWSIAWSQDMRRVFTSTLGKEVRVWQADFGDGAPPLGQYYDQPSALLKTGAVATDLATNADGSRVVMGVQNGTVLLWDGWSFSPLFMSLKAGVANPAVTLIALWDAYAVDIHSAHDGTLIAQVNHPLEDGGILGALWLTDDILLSYNQNHTGRLWRFTYRNDPTPPPVPSATPPAPTLTSARLEPFVEGTIAGRYSITKDILIGQTFIPIEDQIRSLEILSDPATQFGSQVEMILKTEDGEVIAHQAGYIPPTPSLWLPFTFDPPIRVVPGQIYRLEIVGVGQGKSSLAIARDSYSGGFLYRTETLHGDTITRYYILYDLQFRLNLNSAASLAPTQTEVARIETIIPATMTAVSIAATATQSYLDLNATATAIAVGTRAAALGVNPFQVESLSIGVSNLLTQAFEAQPGERLNFKVGAMECCYMFSSFDQLKVRWSVSPIEGAEINPETGEFRVLESASDGTVYTVQAVLADSTVLTTSVHVYTPAGNPLVGTWREDAQLSCTDGSFVKPLAPIQELVFRANRSLAVTWHPFEIYFDYGGTYEYSLRTGQFSFEPRLINYLPNTLNTQGKFRLDDQNRLVLEGIWLGTPPNGESAEVNCGHRFVRAEPSFR